MFLCLPGGYVCLFPALDGLTWWIVCFGAIVLVAGMLLFVFLGLLFLFGVLL